MTSKTSITKRPRRSATGKAVFEWARLEGVPETEAALCEYHGYGIADAIVARTTATVRIVTAI